MPATKKQPVKAGRPSLVKTSKTPTAKASQGIAVPKPPEEAKPLNWQARYPSAFWELVELVLAGVPESALKAYRRTLVVGKGKRLSARQADAAIGGAHIALGKVHKREPEQGTWHARQVWYGYNQLNVVVAHEWADELTPEQVIVNERAARVAHDNHVQVTYLIWDAEGVDRTVV